MVAPSRPREPDRCRADRPLQADSGKGHSDSDSCPAGTPCCPEQPRTEMAQPHCISAPGVRNGGRGAALGAAEWFHLRGWPPQSALPVPHDWLASTGSRVLPAGKSLHSFLGTSFLVDPSSIWKNGRIRQLFATIILPLCTPGCL